MARKPGQHGGWRFGAGARPIPEAERLVPLSLRVSRDQLERLIQLDPSGKHSAAVTGREIVAMMLELSDEELQRKLAKQFAKTEAIRKDMEARRVWHVRIAAGPAKGHYLVPSERLMREKAGSPIKPGRRFKAFDRDTLIEYEVEIVDGDACTVNVRREIGMLPAVKTVEPMSKQEASATTASSRSHGPRLA